MVTAPANLAATVISCTEIQLTWDQTLGPNLIPAGNYPGESLEPYIVAVVTGKNYRYTSGASEVGAICIHDDGIPEHAIDLVSGSNFIAVGPAVLITYEPLAPITATLKEATTLSYRVYRNEVLVGEPAGTATSFNDTGLTDVLHNNYRVEAVGVDDEASSEVITEYWVKRLGGVRAGANTHDSISKLAVDSDGNIIVSGSFLGTLTLGAITLESDPGTVGTAYSTFLAKFSRAGVCLWAKAFPDGLAKGIATDSDDNIYACGTFRKSTTFGGDTFASNAESQSFIAKFDSDGTHLWSKAFRCVGDSGQVNDANSIAVDSDDNPIMVGSFSRDIHFGGVYLGQGPYGGVNGFVVKFLASGDHAWSKFFVNVSDSYFTSVAVDSADNVIITGLFKSGPGRLWPDGAEISTGSAISTDVSWPMVIKTNPGGDHIWSLTFGGNFTSVGTHVIIDSEDHIIAGGYFFFGIIIDGTQYLGGSVISLYLAKIDPDGDHVWANVANAVYGGEVRLDGDNKIFAAGQIGSSSTTIDGNAISYDPGTGRNSFLLKRAADGSYVGYEMFIALGDDDCRALAIDGGAMVLAGVFRTEITIDGVVITATSGTDIFFVRRPIVPVCIP